MQKQNCGRLPAAHGLRTATRAASSSGPPRGVASHPKVLGRLDPLGHTQGEAIRSVADRVAVLVVSVVSLESDVKTLEQWAAATGVSAGSLRGYCCTVGIRPKKALDFARLLRIVARSEPGVWEPARWLDVSEPRHLSALLARGGLPRSSTAPPTLECFFAHQALVARESGVLCRVVARLNAATAG